MAIRQGRHSVSAIGYGAAVLSSLDGHAALLDSEGTIVAVNEAWDRFGVENEALLSSIGVGVNYTEVCRRAAAHSESARAVLDGLRSVLIGTTPIFRCDYRCDGPETLRWFRLTVTPWRAPGGRVLVLHKDVSEERSLAEIQSRTLKSVGAIVWNADAPSFALRFSPAKLKKFSDFHRRHGWTTQTFGRSGFTPKIVNGCWTTAAKRFRKAATTNLTIVF